MDKDRLPTVKRFATNEAPTELLDRIHVMLLAAFAGDFSAEDWGHTLGGWHVAVFDGERVLSHGAVVPRRIRVGARVFTTGYVEGIATTPPRQGQGLGSLVVTELNEVIRERFELGVLSSGEWGFYERFGWERWRGPTFVIDGDARRRTPDEDDGIMVLRLGPSATIDMTVAIACEARPGDDW